MTIPSYDELTPPIPDVLASETVTQLALFLGNTASRGTRTACGAERQLTELDVGSADATLYASLRGSAADLLAVARDFSPRIMRLSGDEVLLDVSGLGRLIGGPDAIARELSNAAGSGVRVAIAPTQVAARLLAAVDGLDAAARVATGDVAAAVAAIPIERLQPLETLPPGMSVRDRVRPYETCARWGIATLGALATLPAADLASRLGRRGAALQRLARGDDPRPFAPDGDVPRFRQRMELEWPIDALEPLSFVFARLLDPLVEALGRADRGAVAIRLDLRLTDRSTHARVLQLPAPMRDPRVLRTLLLLDLESHPPFGAAREVMIDVVDIELDPAPARITQFSVIDHAVPSPEALSTLIARLTALCGESRVGAADLLDTHRPGAFAMGSFACQRPTPNAQLPPEGTERAPVLRRQRVPPAIRVRVEHGRPVYVSAPRRGMPDGAVVDAAGPWRTSGEWWRGADACRAEGRAAEAQAAAPPRSGGGGWSRDEWDVALTSGAVCRLYLDRATGRWHLDGIYD